ncbi:MAG: HNH endonuclease, partial [Acidimicrobiia bacterium]
MRDEVLTVDDREQRLIADERLIARIRARQMSDLAVLDVSQVASADGSRSLSEWVAARLDVSPDTAKTLVGTMRRIQDRPDLEDRLGVGEVSFDRIEAVSRIPEDVGLLEYADVAGVRRVAAKRTRITAEDEYRTADHRFLVMQPSLDESWWRLWGGLDGHSGALVDKVLTEAADHLPDLADGSKGDIGWRRATALVETLTSGEAPPVPVSVLVDAHHAAGTSGESGVILEAGVGVGRETLNRILCDAEVEVVARAEDGRYMDYGRRQRTAPPALKRALLAKHGFRCAADGCDSRYRLEVHHLVPWAEGGETNQADLVVLCWFHHHVVVHERGFQPYAHPDHGRIRFRKPLSDPDRGPP